MLVKYSDLASGSVSSAGSGNEPKDKKTLAPPISLLRFLEPVPCAQLCPAHIIPNEQPPALLEVLQSLNGTPQAFPKPFYRSPLLLPLSSLFLARAETCRLTLSVACGQRFFYPPLSSSKPSSCPTPPPLSHIVILYTLNTATCRAAEAAGQCGKMPRLNS